MAKTGLPLENVTKLQIKMISYFEQGQGIFPI